MDKEVLGGCRKTGIPQMTWDEVKLGDITMLNTPGDVGQVRVKCLRSSIPFKHGKLMLNCK